VQPKQPDTCEKFHFHAGWDNSHVQAKPFLLFCIAQFVLNTVNPTSSWWERFKEHVDTFPDLSEMDLDLRGMGIIEGWKDWDWQ
jgi:abortive infection bacteriophage resistance protein